ncbi:MAG: EH signature domain [Idiomarinaceae bacterium HL-53]|nr:MAG: EH signature domain [Idiomarinaceae bacterium HL-53]CUS49190.1 EH_Signature domain-containing protein [Idiomarinaceae bacterium HL-53]
MKFTLSDEVYRHNIKRLSKLAEEQRNLAKRAGTHNPKFEAAWSRLFNLLSSGQFDRFTIENRFDVRALAIALTDKPDLRKKITITHNLLESVNAILPRGSSLFIESLYQFFLSDFDSIDDANMIGAWLCAERRRKKIFLDSEDKILCADGPTFIAKQAIQRNTAFNQQIKYWQLDRYASGDFIKRAQAVYFVEQLQNIPVNQPHELLEEVSKKQVAESRYDENDLIGHVALRILIDRAPPQNIHESWQNAVIAIAGDPRVPRSHPRFIKWWGQLSQQQAKKVQGWLSKLDLKLFLEALEDYSMSSRDTDMMRMFPSRKHFLEGMHEAGVITHTKLYLSRNADRYIRKNYKAEHIPDYSIVNDGDRSIIYAELTRGHMIEGSHNCQIWFYKELHESAPVLQFGTQRQAYRSLTIGLNQKMYRYGCEAFDNFNHSPANFSWQRRSIKTLTKLGVNLKASDVLSDEDYKRYKRIYGVG